MHIVAGRYKHRKILMPKGNQTRPTTERLRESLFSICQQHVSGAKVLDLFAGSGAIGLEALSRGASSVVFVDQSRFCTTCIRENLKNFRAEQDGKVITADVFTTLKKLGKEKTQFDLIYADPPYLLFANQAMHDLVLQSIEEGGLLSANGMVFIEEEERGSESKNVPSSLCLVNTRRSGKAILYQYKVAHPNQRL